jgi:hypothetical protein
MSRADFLELKQRRQEGWAGLFRNEEDDCAPDTEEVPLSVLPSVACAWPELLDTAPVAPAPPAVHIAIPAAEVSPDWLLHPALTGKYLDVEYREPSRVYGVRCDTWTGTIEGMPTVKKGIRGSVRVKLGVSMATRSFIKITSIFPMQTNEFEGRISRESARPILDVMGAYVIIIGPDNTGSRAHIGKMGFVTHSRAVSIDGDLHWFPTGSVCRSDPYPKP